MIYLDNLSLYLSSSVETISVSSKASQYAMDEKFRFYSIKSFSFIFSEMLLPKLIQLDYPSYPIFFLEFYFGTC